MQKKFNQGFTPLNPLDFKSKGSSFKTRNLTGFTQLNGSKKFRNLTGFTILELLVVIVVIGVLASLTMVIMISTRAKARDVARVSDMKQLQTALETYHANEDTYPVAITSGLPLVGPSGSTYMTKVPNDPTPGRKYVYNAYNSAGHSHSSNGDTTTIDQGAPGPYTSYSVSYSLEADMGATKAGPEQMTPTEVVSTCQINCLIGGVGDGSSVDTGNGNPVCSPNCSGKQCGDDGCGGVCGTGCALIQDCSAAGQCVPDSYTKLLLNLDNDFNDSSTRSHTVNNYDITLDAATKKFGAGSGYFINNHKRLEISDASDFDLSNSDAVVDFWFYLVHAGQGGSLFSLGDSKVFYNPESHGVQAGFYGWGTADSGALAFGVWYHLALVMHNGQSSLYVNGNRVGNPVDRTPNPQTKIIVGSADSSSDPMTYYIDEFRVSKGTTRGWTSNFTPPSAPY